jgi:hypothetical protein
MTFGWWTPAGKDAENGLNNNRENDNHVETGPREGEQQPDISQIFR